jgi:hypothetical protein
MLEKLLGSWSFGTTMGHLACCQVTLLASSMGVKPSFNGPTCCPHLFWMLGFDCFYTNLSFLAKWSPYSSWCGGTCRVWYLSLLGCIMRYLCDVTWGHPITYLTFWEFSGAILSSNAIFFDGPTTWIEIYFASRRCSFWCCANMSLFFKCRFSNMGLVISSS